MLARRLSSRHRLSTGSPWDSRASCLVFPNLPNVADEACLPCSHRCEGGVAIGGTSADGTAWRIWPPGHAGLSSLHVQPSGSRPQGPHAAGPRKCACEPAPGRGHERWQGHPSPSLPRWTAGKTKDWCQEALSGGIARHACACGSSGGAHRRRHPSPPADAACRLTLQASASAPRALPVRPGKALHAECTARRHSCLRGCEDSPLLKTC